MWGITPWLGLKSPRRATSGSSRDCQAKLRRCEPPHRRRPVRRVLGPVPGATPEERRQNLFAYVDRELETKLSTAGFEPHVWDDKKLAIIEAYFGRFLHLFESGAGPFAPVASHWASERSVRQ